MSSGEFSPYISFERVIAMQRHEDGLTTREMLNARVVGIGKVGPHRYDAASAVIESRLFGRFPEEACGDSGDLIEHISNVDGPSIEVGGPTQRYDQPLMLTKDITARTKRKVYNLNVLPQPENDLQADANHLPFASGKLGFVIASCLPLEAREHFFEEAERTIEPGGILAYQRGNDLDLYHALTLGFKMLAYSREPRTDIGEEFSLRDTRWNFALQKQ